ncbi:MAG: AMP-binding protein, partial [Polyangiaceae bacterium]|nr:AMP-binding protein [Polyangiaceae bacterium]
MGLRERVALEWLDISGQLRMLWYIDRFLGGRPHSAATCLTERAASHRDHLALLYADERYTWREVDQRVNRYVSFFRRRGIAKGDVVALLMDNRPDFVFITLGLNRLGAVAALINTNIIGAGLVHAINIAKPKLAVIGAEHLDAVTAIADDLAVAEGQLLCHVEGSDEVALSEGFERIDRIVLAESSEPPSGLPPANSSDVMCYIYTSGTTGLPKAAIISNRRFLAAAYLFGASIMEATPRDVIYVALPLYHSSAMYAGLGAALGSGAAVALRRKFSASHFWKDVVTYDASIFLYIGEVCRYLLNTPESAVERGHRIRLGVGNGLRPDVWERFQRRFNVPLIREFYGATEGNAPIVNFAGKPGMVGRLRPGQVLVRCDETTGELVRDSRGFCIEVGPREKGILLGKINKLFSFDGYVDESATKKKIVENVFAPGDTYF